MLETQQLDATIPEAEMVARVLLEIEIEWELAPHFASFNLVIFNLKMIIQFID